MSQLLALLFPQSSFADFEKQLGRRQIAREAAFAFLLGVFFAFLRFAVFYGIGIHPDEAYYWTWSRRLDWAYYDFNLGIAFYIRLFTSLFGESYLALKLAAIFPFPFIIVLLYLCAQEAGLRFRSALLVIFAFGVMPIFWVGSMLILHDTGLMISWIAAFYFSLRYIKRKENGSLYFLFLFLGIGALFKHSMVVFVFALLLWYLLWYKKYPLLSNIHFWFSLSLCVLALVPPFIWNLENNWEQIGAMLYHRAGIQGTPGWLTLFGGQLISFVPFWYLAFLALCFYVLFKTLKSKCKSLRAKQKKGELKFFSFFGVQKKREEEEKGEKIGEYEQRRRALWHFIWINALILHIFFLFFAHKRSIQANWLFPSYPAMLLILLAYFPFPWALKGTTQASNRFPKNKFFSFFYKPMLYAGFLFALFINLYLSLSQASFEKLGLRPRVNWVVGNITAGYDVLISEINHIRKQRDPKAGIVGLRYQDAALAEWYLPGHEYVPALSMLIRNQYAYWPLPEKGRNYFIFITLKWPNRHLHLDKDPFSKLCQKMYPLGGHTIKVDKLALKRYHLWYCKNYRHHWYEIALPLLKNDIYRMIVH